MAALVGVAPGPLVNWETFAETVRNGRPSRPIELDPGAFYRPLVEATFPTMLRAATRLDLKIGYRRRVAPRVLDLGAGAAPWAIAILTACPDGTAVVNDLADVLPVAGRTIAEHGLEDRVELRPGDFHEVMIEDGAYDIVVLGHVLRTEGAAGAQHLVRRAAAALRPEGTLIVADYFCDDTRKATPFSVLMGVTMLAATERGYTFTYAEVSGWLREAGLESIRLLEPIGFQQAFVATAPRR
jgi:SAM-dependent methyltransferase